VDDRDRGFWRDPRYPPIDKFIEHQIANDQDSELAEAPEGGLESGGGEVNLG
jgi:hypothetical protein